MSLTVIANKLADEIDGEADQIKAAMSSQFYSFFVDLAKKSAEKTKKSDTKAKKPRGPKVVYEAKVSKPTMICQVFKEKTTSCYLLFSSEEELKKVAGKINDSSATKSKILAQNKAKEEAEKYGFYLKLRSAKNLETVKKYFTKNKYDIFATFEEFQKSKESGSDSEDEENEEETGEDASEEDSDE